jgi:hypothetical protein
MTVYEKEILSEIIHDLLTNGIIRESSSPYASLVLLVKRPEITGCASIFENSMP